MLAINVRSGDVYFPVLGSRKRHVIDSVTVKDDGTAVLVSVDGESFEIAPGVHATVVRKERER